MKRLAAILALAVGVLFAPAAKAESLAFNPGVLIVSSKPVYAPAKYRHGHEHHKQYRHHVRQVKQKHTHSRQCAPRYTPAYYNHHHAPRPPYVWWYR